MTDDAKAKLIFQKWKAELADKDKKMERVSDNFGELFYELYKADIPFGIANSYIKDAITAHLPSGNTAQHVHRTSSCRNMPFKDFFDGWKEKINDKATAAFFCFYSLDGDTPQTGQKFGSMSAQEYAMQRKYAESFPILDVEKIKAEMQAIREAAKKAAEGTSDDD